MSAEIVQLPSAPRKKKRRDFGAGGGGAVMSDSKSAESDASPFRIAYADWMRARATVAALEVCEEVGFEAEKENERQTAAAFEVRADAEWKLMRTPAGSIVEIRYRALVVQEMFSDASWRGDPTDNRHHLMLAALVSEILSPVAEE